LSSATAARTGSTASLGHPARTWCGAALVTILLFETACASLTSYGPLGEHGGYTERRLAPAEYEVTFEGDAAASPDLLHRYLRYRCAELTIEEGFDAFDVRAIIPGSRPAGQPAPATGQGHGKGGGGGRGAGAGSGSASVGLAGRAQPRAGTEMVPTETALMKLYKGERPEPAVDARAYLAAHHGDVVARPGAGAAPLAGQRQPAVLP